MFTDKKQPLIVILGPTASGKTGYSIELARLINGEIISADSRAIYRGMNIGTAKPTEEEQAGVPHWGIDLVNPDERFTLYDYQQYALAKVEQIRQRGHVPMLVGGSGLYIDSVIYNYQLGNNDNDVDLIRRAKLEQLSVSELKSYAIAKGIELPADTANPRRLIRAIETGGVNKKCSQLPDDTIVIGIKTEREALDKRIILRAKQMLADGLEDEVRGLFQQYGETEPLHRNAYGVMRSLWGDDISIKLTNAELDQFITKFVISDKHLVKKQLTWWRSPKRAGDIMWRTLTDLRNQLISYDGLMPGAIIDQLMIEYKKFRTSN